MRIVLHIGLEKTGSTAIQRYCALNRGALAKAGIHYPSGGVSGARGSDVLRRAAAPILGFAGLATANRSVARAFNGLIAASNGGMVIGWKPNGDVGGEMGQGAFS